MSSRLMKRVMDPCLLLSDRFIKAGGLLSFLITFNLVPNLSVTKDYHKFFLSRSSSCSSSSSLPISPSHPPLPLLSPTLHRLLLLLHRLPPSLASALRGGSLDGDFDAGAFLTLAGNTAHGDVGWRNHSSIRPHDFL